MTSSSPRRGRCVLCMKDNQPVRKTQLDDDGPMLDICDECNDGPIREREHLFGGGSGIGDGNRRRGIGTKGRA